METSPRIHFTTSPRGYELLVVLSRIGLYGRTPAEVVRRIVEARLHEMIDEEPLRSMKLKK